MKVKLQIASPVAVSKTSLDCNLEYALQTAQFRDELFELTGKIDEIDQITDNLILVSKTIKTYNSPKAAMEALDCVAACEQLLGVAAEKVSVKAAQEGLGSAIADAWKKFVEFVKKIWNTIVGWFKGSASKKAETVEEKAEEAVKGIEEAKEKVKEDAQKPAPASGEKPKPSVVFDPNHKLKTKITTFWHGTKHIPVTLNELLRIATESNARIIKMLKEADDDTASGYSEWLAKSLKDSKTAGMSWEWSVGNDSGDGDIKISYKTDFGTKSDVSTLSEAGIKSEGDAAAVKELAKFVRSWISKLSALPDISNYMKDSWVDSEQINNLPSSGKNGAMSIKAAVKLHLRFFGLLGNMVVNQTLRQVETLAKAIEESTYVEVQS